MEGSDFWKLFAETGEPYYWLLSRAENRTGAPMTGQASTPESAPMIQPAPE